MTIPTPRLCVIGPMVGRNPGLVTTQGERLADLFAATGFKVISVSNLANRYLRSLDIAATILRRRHEFDVAVLQVFSGPSFVVEDLSSRLLEAVGRPMVMVLRGGGMPVFASDRPAWTRRVLRRASAIITPSSFLARAIRPLGFDARVIPNVIELDQYRFRQRSVLAPNFLWMRSFHDVYDPAFALRVFARIRASRPDARLVMAGSDLGSERSMHNLAAEIGVAGAVTFPGFLNPAAKAAAFDAADIYLNTNRIDNMPVTIVEACAAGVPVLTTRVGGISDLLRHEETGLLIAERDEDAFAAAATRLLADHELAARLSRNGRQLAERSAAPEVLPQWSTLLGDVAARSAA